MKALGTMLPGNGAWRSAQCQRVVHSAPHRREPSKNTGQRTQYRALEAWYGSVEASLSRPLSLAERLFQPCSLCQFGAIARPKCSP